MVELDVSSGVSLGFRLLKRKGLPGFAIKSVDRDGLAERAGGVAKGDYIIAVNGKDTSKVTDIKVIGKLIKSAKTTLALTFASSGGGEGKKAVVFPGEGGDPAIKKGSVASAAKPEPLAPEPIKKKEWNPKFLGVLPVAPVDVLAVSGKGADALLRTAAKEAILDVEVHCTKITPQFGLPEGFELELKVSLEFAARAPRPHPMFVWRCFDVCSAQKLCVDLMTMQCARD